MNRLIKKHINNNNYNHYFNKIILLFILFFIIIYLLLSLFYICVYSWYTLLYILLLFINLFFTFQFTIYFTVYFTHLFLGDKYALHEYASDFPAHKLIIRTRNKGSVEGLTITLQPIFFFLCRTKFRLRALGVGRVVGGSAAAAASPSAGSLRTPSNFDTSPSTVSTTLH